MLLGTDSPADIEIDKCACFELQNRKVFSCTVYHMHLYNVHNYICTYIHIYIYVYDYVVMYTHTGKRQREKPEWCPEHPFKEDNISTAMDTASSPALGQVKLVVHA